MKITIPIEITLEPKEITEWPKKLTKWEARRLVKTEKVVHSAVKKFGVPKTDEEIEKMARYIHESLRKSNNTKAKT